MTEFVPNSLATQVAEDAALYSLGLLDPSSMKGVESRLRSGCPLCATEVAACSVTAGDLASTLPPAPVAPPLTLRSRLMAFVAGERETGRDMRVIKGGFGEWVPGAVPGSSVKQLDGNRTFLLRLEPGIAFPPHEHSHGAEQCLVVEGSATAAGVAMETGDFISMPHGSYHEELVGGSSGCVLFISYK